MKTGTTHITCIPTVGGSGTTYWAVCRQHGWKQGPYTERADAVRSKAAHQRAKRTRRK